MSILSRIGRVEQKLKTEKYEFIATIGDEPGPELSEDDLVFEATINEKGEVFVRRVNEFKKGESE